MLVSRARGRLSGWLGANRVMLSNAVSLVGTTAVTSGLGFVYWWLAARQFDPAAVGLASAIVSSMTLLGTISMWGMGTLLIGEMPKRTPEGKVRLIVTALLFAALIGLGLGLLFVPFAALLSPDLGMLAANPAYALLFALGVSLTSATLVLDQALVGLLLGSLQLWRNGVFAAGKLVVLAIAGLLLSAQTGVSIYATWLVGMVLSLSVLGCYAVYKGVWRMAWRPEWSLLRGLHKSAFSHHLLNLSLLVPGLSLPVLVTSLLSTTASAHFYIAWMVASFIFVGPGSLALVLYAVGDNDRQALAQKVRLCLKLTLLIGVAANIALAISAGWLLNLFGKSYASEAEWCLRLLGLGTFSLAIKDFYVTLYRVYGRLGRAIAPVVTGALLELLLAGCLAAFTGSLIGLTLGWLAATLVEAAAMSYTVYRAAFPKVEVKGQRSEIRDQDGQAAIYAIQPSVVSDL